VFHHRSTHGPVDLAFTDRYGGVSAVPYDELNLALDDGDDPAARAENLRRVVAEFAPGATVAQVRQVHGADVDRVDDRRYTGIGPEADAMVHSESAVLMIRVADCVPVLLADAEAHVIGAAHAGRPGMVAGVVPATVAAMRDLGASRITAWIGPHICGRCYEVPETMRTEVGSVEPASVSTTSWGTPSLDIGAGVRAQLEAAGVTVHDVSACTRESAALYSYRRDGHGAGRLAGLIRLRGTR
jgi:YfiH family protein